MSALRFVLGDQLSRSIPTLRGIDPAQDTVLMVEVAEETTYVPHHKQKIAFILSAMRHFAEDLRAEGMAVDYVRLDDPDNSGSFTGELERAVRRHLPDEVFVTEPGEFRVLETIEGWSGRLNVPVHLRPDDRFFCSTVDFGRWAEGRRGFRMEHFYRLMRERTGLLMQDGEPMGGRWNFDTENRKPLPPDLASPERLRFEPDADHARRDGARRCALSRSFRRPRRVRLGRDAAARARGARSLRGRCPAVLRRLPGRHAVGAAFPVSRDAVTLPQCRAPDGAGGLCPGRAAYAAGLAPLNAVEGFVRQILGWREYIRGIYWLRMPDYKDTNALGATRALPAFYWTGETEMNCLYQAIADTRHQAYAHHINRLMVTGNFALMAGIAPAEIEEWYLCVYADAYDWVELPNVHGMSIYADGGLDELQALRGRRRLHRPHVGLLRRLCLQPEDQDRPQGLSLQLSLLGLLDPQRRQAIRQSPARHAVSDHCAMGRGASRRDRGRSRGFPRSLPTGYA